MKRIRGVAQVQLMVAAGVTVVVLALLATLALAWDSAIEEADRHGYERGVAETSDGWRRRAAMEQAEFQEAYDELRAEMDRATMALNQQLHEAQTAYENERKDHEQQKAANARIERDLRAARLVLRDPGKTGRAAPSEACRGEGTAGADAKPGGDGPAAAEGQLSAELGGFLWAEASRADEVVSDLEARLRLAQDAVTAYYLIAKECHER